VWPLEKRAPGTRGKIRDEKTSLGRTGSFFGGRKRKEDERGEDSTSKRGNWKSLLVSDYPGLIAKRKSSNVIENYQHEASANRGT